MMRLGRTIREAERGQTLVLFALMLTVLLGISALAVDYGGWLVARRTYQNVTDAAVLTGVQHLTAPIGDPCAAGKNKPTCAREAAWEAIKDAFDLTLDSAVLGEDDTPEATPYEEDGFRIWVSTPPQGSGAAYPGQYGASNRVLFARVERDLDSFLGRILGQGTTEISAWATAGSEREAQFAVTGLCGNDPADNSDCSPGNKAAVKVNTVTGITIIGGDFASNRSLIVTGGGQGNSGGNGLTLADGDAYIVGADGCSQQTWSCPPATTGGIRDTATPPNAIPAIELNPPAEDPAYPEPTWTNCKASPVVQDCVPVRGSGANGSGNNYTPGDFICNGNNQNACGTGIPQGSTSGSGTDLTCHSSSPRLAPGYYDEIRNNGCVILDATSPGTATSYTSTTGLWDGQRPGIYRIKTELNVNYIVGDGITLFLDPGARLSISGGIILNTNNTCSAPHPGMPSWSDLCSGTDFSQAAWTSAGEWVWDACSQSGLPATTRCVGLGGYRGPSMDKADDGTGIAIYVRKASNSEPGRPGCGQSTPGSRTSCVFQQAGGTGLQFTGTLYGPRDNLVVSGNADQRSTNQIIAWTITYNGTATLTQTYSGPPPNELPLLLEPTLGQ